VEAMTAEVLAWVVLSAGLVAVTVVWTLAWVVWWARQAVKLVVSWFEKAL